MSEIKQLRQQLKHLQLPYGPAGMVEAGEQLQVPGRAFFPVGRGLWEDTDETVSDKQVMVLGQDFGTVEYTEKEVLGRGGEKTSGNPTWNNLLALLMSADVRATDCFFTNAIMGLRLNGSNTDTPTAFKHTELVHGCRRFFLEQVRAQRPRLILALGYWPVHFLSQNLSPQLSEQWGSAKSITPVVAEDEQAVVREATFSDIADFQTTVVALFHPSLRGVNVSKLAKSTQGRFGQQTESNRIRQALEIF